MKGSDWAPNGLGPAPGGRGPVAAVALLKLVALVALPAADVAHADESYYGFSPMSTLVLGHGLSPNHLDQAKIPCVSFREVPADPGALGTRFHYFLVTSSQQLDDALGLDQSIDASYLTLKGSESFSYSAAGMFHGDSVTMVIRASTEFARRTISDVALTPYAQGLIDRDQMTRFEADCGSYLATLERLGSSAAAIITLEQVDENASDLLNLGLKNGGGLGPVSAGAKLSFRREMKKIRRAGYLDVQVVSTGGGGLAALSELVKAAAEGDNSYDRIEAALSTYLKDFGPSNPAPIGFHVVPMPFGFRPGRARLWDERKQSLLAAIAARYRGLERDSKRVRQMIALADTGQLPVADDRLASYRKELPGMEEFLNVLADAHERCMDEKLLDACRMPSLSGAGFVIPSQPPLPRLIASGETRDALRLWGVGVETIQLFLNGERVWWNESTPRGPEIKIDLKPYWDRRRLVDRGPVSGKLEVHDVFGRSYETFFYKAVHPYEGGPALYEEFKSEGGL